MKNTKHKSLVLALVLLALLAAGVFVVTKLSGGRDRRIEKLIERYTTEPDQRTANRLVELVRTGSVPLETGDAILEALSRPTVHTRDSYAAGTEPLVSITYPCSLSFSFRGAKLRYSAGLYDHPSGKDFYFSASGNELGYKPQCLERHYRLRAYSLRAGMHNLTVRIHCALTPPKITKKWRWPSLRRFPRRLLPFKSSIAHADVAYECSHEFPLRLNIVDKEQELKVKLLSNEELDRKMNGAFTVRQVQPHSVQVAWATLRPVRKEGTVTSSYTDKGGMAYIGTTQFSLNSPPAHFAFEAIYRDGKTGREGPVKSGVVLKGCSATFGPAFNFSNCIREPGTHSGTLILRPSIKATRDYPEIQQMWGGTFEFPITFEAEKKSTKEQDRAPSPENDP